MVFEGAIKDFYYDEFPEQAPNAKDSLVDGDFAQCDLIKSDSIQVVSYGKEVLKGVYSMQRDLEVSDESAIKNGQVIMQIEPILAVVDKKMIR